jgi:hypothetical protein
MTVQWAFRNVSADLPHTSLQIQSNVHKNLIIIGIWRRAFWWTFTNQWKECIVSFFRVESAVTATKSQRANFELNTSAELCLWALVRLAPKLFLWGWRDLSVKFPPRPIIQGAFSLHHRGSNVDCLCGLVVRVPGYRSGSPGSISGAATFSEK